MSHEHRQQKNPNAPMTNVCIYRMKEADEKAFLTLLDKHWPTLNAAGLVTSEQPKIYRTVDRKNRICYIEIFTWVNGEAPNVAHQTPSVMQVWEPMGAILEDMEFLNTDD
jgi:hypothetical protein